MEFKVIGIASAVAFMTIAGCNPYDDTKLTERVDNLEDRVEALEERVEEFQASVDEFTELINQYKNEARIKDFTETSDGFLLTFADGREMHIKHGELPELSVIFDEELKEYVWTANGKVVTDKDGKPVSAYIAPEFEVRDGKLGYTLGNEWHEVMNGETVGLIADVVETEDGVNFILSSGTTISIPKVGFRLDIEYFEYGVAAGKTVNIEYTIVDGDDNAEILVYPDEGFNVNNTGYSLEVTLPSDEAAAYSGKVLVVAVNGNGATSAKVLRFGTLVTEVTSADVMKVSRHGGLVGINIRSNRPYGANIQSDPITFIPPEWIRPAENPATKAAREDVVYYEVDPMPDDLHENREATVLVEWYTNIKEEQEDWETDYTIKKEIVIMQLDTKDVAVDKPTDNDGNLYPSDYTKETARTGKLEGGWTFVNCAVVDNVNGTNTNIPDGEVRFALNGIKDKKGVLTSPVFENGIGTLFIHHGGNRNVATQDTKFTVECFKKSDNSSVKKQEIYYKGLKQQLYKEEIAIDCNEPCYIVITNTSTRATTLKTGLVNCSIFYSMFYSEYKAE